MSIQRAFAPYEGPEPYVFISYAHADWAAVEPVISALHDRGYRLWYDEGIEPGSEWPESIAEHLAGAALVLAFLSESYTASPNCRRELHFALTKRIPTLNVFLERTALSPGLEMQIGNSFALMKYEMSEAVFYDKLYAAPQLPASGAGGEQAPRRARKPRASGLTGSQRQSRAGRRRRRRIAVLLTVLLLLAAGIALAVVGHFTGLTERLQLRLEAPAVEKLPGGTVCSFTSPLLEQAARTYSGIAEGPVTVADLAGLTGLWLWGDEVFFDEPESWSGGEGSLEELGDLRFFTGLRRLSLRGQPLRELKSLPAMNLESLAVENGRLTSLQGVGQLPRLRELSTDGSPVAELGDLNRCLELRRLSLLDANVTDFSALRPLIHLTEISLSHANLDSIDVVLKKGYLTSLRLTDCDLRGRFFKAFDSERRLVSLSLESCALTSTENLEDFTGLTELRLLGCGEGLDWSRLAELPALSRVTVDETSAGAVHRALDGTDVQIEEAAP